MSLATKVILLGMMIGVTAFADPPPPPPASWDKLLFQSGPRLKANTASAKPRTETRPVERVESLPTVVAANDEAANEDVDLNVAVKRAADNADGVVSPLDPSIKKQREVEKFDPIYFQSRNGFDIGTMTRNELLSKMIDLQREQSQVLKCAAHVVVGGCLNLRDLSLIQSQYAEMRERYKNYDQSKMDNYIALSGEAAILHYKGRKELSAGVDQWSACDKSDNACVVRAIDRQAHATVYIKEYQKVSPASADMKRNRDFKDSMSQNELLAKMVDIQESKIEMAEKGDHNYTELDEQLKDLNARLLAKVKAGMKVQTQAAKEIVNLRDAKSLLELADAQISQAGTQLLDVQNPDWDSQSATDNADIRSKCRISVKPVNSTKELNDLQTGETMTSWKFHDAFDGVKIRPPKALEVDRNVARTLCAGVEKMFKSSCWNTLMGRGTFEEPPSVVMKSSDGKTAEIFYSEATPQGLMRCLEHYSFSAKVKDIGAPGAGDKDAASLANGADTRR